MKIPPIEERVRNLLRLAAKKIRPCKLCAAELFFIEHANGKPVPYTSDGTNHFLNCPNADQFRRLPGTQVAREAAMQVAMFDKAPFPE